MAELKRSLGFGALLALSITSIIGTGLFLGPSIAAGYSGTASVISWLILAAISLYIAACFGELVAMFPKAGGLYEYAKQTYGRFWSFVVGWLSWVTENIFTTLMIVAAIGYILPAQFPVLFKMGISIFFIIALNIIVYIGIEASSVMVITFAIITFIVLLAAILPGFALVKASNFIPFFTHPFSKIFLSIFFIAETFFGYEAATYMAEETKNPEKVIPRALVYGTLAVALFGISIVVILLGAFGWQKLSGLDAPLLDISKMFFGNFSDYFMGVGIYLVMLGSAATGVIATPRLLLALARDKLFLAQFSRIHEKFKTPYKAIIFQAIVSIMIVVLGYGKYKTLLSISVPLGFIMYIFALISIPILRIKKPNIARPFKLPFGVVGPILVTLFFLAIIFTWIRLEPNAFYIFLMSIGIIALGIPIYFLLEMYYNPRMVRKTNNVLAYLAYYTERLFLPLGIRKELIQLLGNIKGKKILEFGCSVGTLTMHLADEVGPKGKVYATDISERDLWILKKRLAKKGHKHVTILHDIEHETRVHPNVPVVDAAVSVGTLGYVQNVKNVLREINKRLGVGSKILFLDYDKFFDIIPNIEWLSDDNKIKRIFHDAGFTVGIIRKQGFAWKYIYIYGTKFKGV